MHTQRLRKSHTQKGNGTHIYLVSTPTHRNIPHNTDTLRGIWTVLCTASSQHQINPAHTISLISFLFVKKGATWERSFFFYKWGLQRTVWGEQKGSRKVFWSRMCGAASQHWMWLPCYSCLQTAQCVLKQFSVPWRHNLRLEDPLHKMFGNVIWCFRAHTKSVLWKAVQRINVWSFVRLWPHGGWLYQKHPAVLCALVAPVRFRPLYPKWITQIVYGTSFSTPMTLYVFIFLDREHFLTSTLIGWAADEGLLMNNLVLNAITLFNCLQKQERHGILNSHLKKDYFPSVSLHTVMIDAKVQEWIHFSVT